jgi:hypothetical protein
MARTVENRADPNDPSVDLRNQRPSKRLLQRLSVGPVVDRAQPSIVAVGRVKDRTYCGGVRLSDGRTSRLSMISILSSRNAPGYRGEA